MKRKGLSIVAKLVGGLQWILLTSAALCVLVVAIALIFPGTFRSVELVVPVGFSVEGPAATLAAGAGARQLVIHSASGFTRISADTAGITLIGGAIFAATCLAAAVACRHFRRIVVDAMEDRHFGDGTASDVRRIGWMVAAIGLLQSAYIVFTFLYTSNRMSSVVIQPTLQPLRGVPLVVAGLIVLALGGVFERGAELQRDHDLTV